MKRSWFPGSLFNVDHGGAEVNKVYCLLFFTKYFQGMSLFPSWWQYYCFHYFFSYLLLSMFIFSMLSGFPNIIFFCHYYDIIYLSYNSLFLLQPHRILIKDRTLSEIKANLIHSFLTVSFSSFILFIIIQMFYFLKILTLFEIFEWLMIIIHLKYV